MKNKIMVCLIALLPHVALASSPISAIGGASVTKGAKSIEARLGYTEADEPTAEDGRLRLRQHFDYGVTDWYAARLIVVQDKLQGENIEHSEIGLENRFQLIEKRDYGWDGGVRVIYTQADGDKRPNTVSVRLLATVPVLSNLQWRYDQFMAHEVGADARSGLALEFRNQLNYATSLQSDYFKTLEVGAEMFNDFKRLNQLSGYQAQDHQMGPVVKMKFDNGAYVETGYRAGISTGAADHSFKLFVGRQF